ncbi:MAG TPA: hypothetical protein VJP79_07630 [Nitrososphaera sp.]|nr:hypothetical protein [Nitrososphaera sp.]
MKYRSRSEIIPQKADAANGGCTKTGLMFKAFLTYKLLTTYINLLVTALSRVIEVCRVLRTTNQDLGMTVGTQTFSKAMAAVKLAFEI